MIFFSVLVEALPEPAGEEVWKVYGRLRIPQGSKL